MKIKYINRWQDSHVKFVRSKFSGIRGLGITKNKKHAHSVAIGTSNKKYTPFILTHEIGHLLSAHTFSAPDYGIKLIRLEMLACRLAKSYLKPKYYVDYFARDNIYNYMKNSTPELYQKIIKNHNNPRKRLKIIPLNRGFKIK
jgi:hypothetical protein